MIIIPKGKTVINIHMNKQIMENIIIKMIEMDMTSIIIKMKEEEIQV